LLSLISGEIFFVSQWSNAVEELFRWMGEILCDEGIIIDAVTVGVPCSYGMFHGELEALVIGFDTFKVSITTHKVLEFTIREVF
jgi:hypothetical protein